MKKHLILPVLMAAVMLLTAACVTRTVVVSDDTTSQTQTAPAPVSETATVPVRPVDRSAEAVYQANPNLTPVNYDSPALLPISDDMGMGYIDRITWLCDSPTYWLKPYELLSGGFNTTQIWTGPEGTMTLAYLRDFRILDPFDNTERTIEETVALHKPPFIQIALGINGIAFMDEAYFTEEYTHLIDVIREASPETTIVLQSIYPISPDYRYWGDITNDTVTAANSWILHIAEQYGLRYVDAFSCLVGADGNIIPELVMSDGLHPNKAGLTKVLEYIRTHAYTE